MTFVPKDCQGGMGGDGVSCDFSLSWSWGELEKKKGTGVEIWRVKRVKGMGVDCSLTWGNKYIRGGFGFGGVG